MRLDMQHDRMLEKRRGFAWRTIVATVWFSLCFALAYFFVDYLFDTETLTYNFFHSRLSIPWEWDDWIITAGLVVVVVVAMNLLLLLGYSMFSSTGRRRPGNASLYSSDPDPDDNRYNYH
jgi:ABC-type sugar transport system permease subunit